VAKQQCLGRKSSIREKEGKSLLPSTDIRQVKERCRVLQGEAFQRGGNVEPRLVCERIIQFVKKRKEQGWLGKLRKPDKREDRVSFRERKSPSEYIEIVERKGPIHGRTRIESKAVLPGTRPVILRGGRRDGEEVWRTTDRKVQ